jgi:hypothetical protein
VNPTCIRGLHAALMAAALLLAACSKPNALLLTVSAERRVTSFDFTVRDVTTAQNVAETVGQALPADQDISQPGKELKLAVRFLDAGTYLVHIVGHDASGVQVASRAYRVEGTVPARLRLTALPPGSDADGDGFPSATACAAMAADGFDCAYADCNDNDPRVNPLATERCNGRDDDCDGKLGLDETDADGDGYLKCMDCDPSDETDFNWQQFFDCRDCDDTRVDVHPASRLDPLAHPAALEDCSNCGDGIDHNCDGKLNPCNDADCDGTPGCGKEGAPEPPLCDCDDTNPDIHPGATEICGDRIDNNCDGQKDEGCVPCDVDGDGFMRDDPANGCNPAPGQADCDDTDSSVYPGAATSCGGKQGGCSDMALRGFCARDGSGQVTIHDCNLRDAANDAKCPATDPACQARTGCPSPTCDADGDGFMRSDPANGCNPPAGLEDCDDTDAHTFPGAPDRCGDGKKQNCSYDSPCSDDADGDGYNSTEDCDDNDPNIHPWATELCNGKDDDCDGLTDEGNPDSTTGQTVSGTRCTDIDLGECSKKQGACICSRLVPVATRNPSLRHPCKDENVTAPASPRCFGAGQPQQETAQTCDGLDEDCDGVADDATGEVPCASGTTCKSISSAWKCACDAATGCSGCCVTAAAADQCVVIETVSVGQCGRAGEVCHTCNDANTCTTDKCDQGVCHNDNLANGASCPSGQCRVPTSGGAAQCCGTCWLGTSCAASSMSGCGTGGADCSPLNTSCGLCLVCDGAGGCGSVAAGGDPNGQCSPAQATTTCGRTGVCNGAGACAQYAAGTSCGTCKTCNGAGTCNYVAAGTDVNDECSDEGGCGHDGWCTANGTCRFYPTTKRCGLCTMCDGVGSCTVMPADDDNCSVIDCDLRDTTCRDYTDLSASRCKAPGVCKTPNSADCTDYHDASSSTVCGAPGPLCKLCDGGGGCNNNVGANGSSSGTCTDQGQSSCGTTGRCDGAGACQYYATGSRCGTCMTCAAAHTCTTPVSNGSDPSSDCTACMVCNGAGGCRAVAAGNDPKGDCAQQPASTCGHNGDCDGYGGCAKWPSGTPCGTCQECDGDGYCIPSPSNTTGPNCTGANQTCCNGHCCSPPNQNCLDGGACG